MRGHFQKPSSILPRRVLRAFTLVELLVVIGVIAVLIGILMPVLGKARAAANRTACMSNVRQLYNGILMYCNDNKGYFPTCAYASDGVAYVQYPDDWIWWEANRKLDDSAIAKYVGHGDKLKNLLSCPADNFEGRKTRPGISAGQGPYLYSYYINDNIGRNWKPYGVTGRTKITQWHAPSKKILITEATDVGHMQPVAGYASPLTQRHGTSIFHGNVSGFPQMQYGVKNGSMVSTVFLDGHAEGTDQDFAFNPNLFDPLAR